MMYQVNIDQHLVYAIHKPKKDFESVFYCEKKSIRTKSLKQF